MDMARLNFSHGDTGAHRADFACIRRVAQERGANVAILMDLQGPKIRTGALRNGEPVRLEEGGSITITTREVLGSAACVSTTYSKLPSDVKPGNRLLIADGTLEFRADTVDEAGVHCTVIRGGMLGEHKGINLPGVDIAEPALTAKDREDLELALELGADYVALSFVRSPGDIRELQAIIEARGSQTGVIAKIERPEALDHLEEIAALCDGIMVARGDLGVEIDFEQVPEIQKRLISICNHVGTPVITATQMLESMTSHARPTRAEVGDVANAIYDGTDAVMLSGETAAGLYPVGACETMARIARRVDASPSDPAVSAYYAPGCGASYAEGDGFADAVGQAARSMAETLGVRLIACYSHSGYTARALARHRPRVPIVALTCNPAVQRKLALVWGVKAIFLDEAAHFDLMLARAEVALVSQGLAAPGDTVVLVAGTPLQVGGRTNLLKLHRLGEEY
jgi:pyruvate kinase